MPVYDALYDIDLEHLLCRHEQVAVMATIGYARASNKPGVYLATSGPEATNLITGFADALLLSTNCSHNRTGCSGVNGDRYISGS